MLAEGFVGKKEVWFLAGSPSPAIFTERTGWHNAVDMRVVDELTGPGMQYAHDALEGGDGMGVVVVRSRFISRPRPPGKSSLALRCVFQSSRR